MATPSDRVQVDVRLSDDDLHAALVADARQGLRATPKQMPPVWFYDERGGELFDEITRLPEYYPTRAERAILECHADDIAARSGADTLMELGSGTSTKTTLLLDALTARGRPVVFAPLDVSEAVLRQAVSVLAERYRELQIRAVVGDFSRDLAALPSGGRRMLAFLGGTIGNLTPSQRSKFLFEVDCLLCPGDSLLLGTDLVKDRARLIAAYDDAAGVTAEFNRNLLRVLNRELRADFDPDTFDHVARWDEDERWIEMLLRASRPQTVRLEAIDLVVEFAAGEDLHTEISTKFTPEQVAEELWTAGLKIEQQYTDPAGDFLLTLATPYC